MIQSRNSKEKYFVIFGGFLTFLTFGAFNTSSIVRKVMFDYMHNESFSTKSMNLSDTLWVFAMLSFGTGSSAAAGGFLEKKIGPQYTSLFGGWLMSINICMTYLTIRTYFAIVIISFGFLGGIGIGLGYGAAIRPACSWFQNRQGLAIGLVVSGYELSALIFDGLQNLLIRATNDIPLSFLFIGIIYGILQLIGSMLLKNNPDLKTQPQVDQLLQTEVSEECLISDNVDYVHEMKPHQLLREFNFWILWITFLFNVIQINITSALQHNISEKLKFPKSIHLSIVFISFNCVGRIFWGYLSDCKSYKFTMIIITVCNCILNGILCLILKKYLNSIYQYLIIFGLMSFFNGGNFSIFPSTSLKLYGINHFIINYGMLFTSCSSGTSISIIVLEKIEQKLDKSLQYCQYGSIIGFILSLLAVGLTTVFSKKWVVLDKYCFLF